MNQRKPPSHRGGRPILTREEKLERQRARARLWRERNREKLRAYFQQYAADHREDLKRYHAGRYQENRGDILAAERAHNATPEGKAQLRAYRIANREARNASRREWDRKNPARAKAITARARAKNRERRRQKDRAYRQQTPDVYRQSIARAKAAKPELYKAISVQSSLRRRARKRALPVEPVSRKRIAARDSGRCHLCQRSILERPTFDHLIPVVRGGAHAEWNLMLAHDRCNKSRGTKQILPVETREAAEAYIAARTKRAQEAA